jgi:hypothetical protein
MQRTLLENVLNCFQLTTLAIMISLVDAPHLEILSKGAMTCAKLKQFVTCFSFNFLEQSKYIFNFDAAER